MIKQSDLANTAEVLIKEFLGQDEVRSVTHASIGSTTKDSCEMTSVSFIMDQESDTVVDVNFICIHGSVPFIYVAVIRNGIELSIRFDIQSKEDFDMFIRTSFPNITAFTHIPFPEQKFNLFQGGFYGQRTC